MENNSDSKYTISGTISNDKVTIDKFMVGEKDVINNDFFNSNDNDNKNIKNIKGDIKDKLIQLVNAEVDKKIADPKLNELDTDSNYNSTKIKPKTTKGRTATVTVSDTTLPVYEPSGKPPINMSDIQLNQISEEKEGEENAADGKGQIGGLFRSPSANLKLAMNNPFATAISSSNNIARDMFTNTVSKTLKSAAPRNNATKRFRRFFKTKRRNSNKKARKYTRYHK